MSPRNIFMIFAVAWVGGWGFLMFRYPGFFAKINARFGFNIGTSPKFIAFTRRMGIVEMILAALSVISTLIMHVLGIKGY
jgi:hypothetical protein